MAYSENPSRVMVFPDGNSGNGNVPAWVLPFMGGNFGNNGGLFGGNNGWGGGILGFLLGLMFGNGGFGNFFGGNGWNNGCITNGTTGRFRDPQSGAIEGNFYCPLLLLNL